MYMVMNGISTSGFFSGRQLYGMNVGFNRLRRVRQLYFTPVVGVANYMSRAVGTTIIQPYIFASSFEIIDKILFNLTSLYYNQTYLQIPYEITLVNKITSKESLPKILHPRS